MIDDLNITTTIFCNLSYWWWRWRWRRMEPWKQHHQQQQQQGDGASQTKTVPGCYLVVRMHWTRSSMPFNNANGCWQQQRQHPAAWIPMSRSFVISLWPVKTFPFQTVDICYWRSCRFQLRMLPCSTSWFERRMSYRPWLWLLMWPHPSFISLRLPVLTGLPRQSLPLAFTIRGTPFRDQSRKCSCNSLDPRQFQSNRRVKTLCGWQFEQLIAIHTFGPSTSREQDWLRLS